MLLAPMFASAWFHPLFVRILPWSSLLRMIDLLLYAEPVRELSIKLI